jgi:hypothetical protein
MMFERTYNSRVLLYDEELYDRIYKRTLPDGRTIRYGRELVRMSDHWIKQYRVLTKIGVNDLGPILLVGCGFSPLLTAFSNGHKTIGTDPSPYIQKYQDQESDSPHRILPYAVPDPELTKVAEQTEFRWVITDDALSSLNGECQIGRPRESEAEWFIDGCSELGTHVIHFVTTGTVHDHPLYFLRTLEEWQEYAPHHLFIDANTYEVSWQR